MRLRFKIVGSGDSSVGIPNLESIITVDDNSSWDDRVITDFRCLLADFYDLPVGCVGVTTLNSDDSHNITGEISD